MENSPPHVSPQDSTQISRPRKQASHDLSGLEPDLWKENHGNWLLAFTAVLCLIGVSIIACQQSRFTPPSFPSRLAPSPESDDPNTPSNVQTGQPAKNMRIVGLRILGAASDDGVMRIAMYISPEGFNDPANAYEVDSWQIINGVCEGRWEISPQHKQVAIAAFHDANENGELDRNSLGVPTERYGFTGGARGYSERPTFEEAAITVDEKQIDISIR